MVQIVRGYRYGMTKTSSVVIICAFLLPSSRAQCQSPQSFLSLLHGQLGGNETELAQSLKDGVVAEMLAHHDDGELAAGGAVRIPVTLDHFVEKFRSISDFKRDAAVLAITKFGDPPSIRDLARLTLLPEERKSLEECRPGNCKIKMSAEMMRRVQTHRAASVDAQFRSALWDYISVYLQKGTPAMPEYDDKKQVVHGAAEFKTLLTRFGWLQEYAPALMAALNAPYQNPKGDRQLEEFLYWSRENFGLKQVISVTHVFIHRRTIGGRDWAFLASKQIYASHYTNASLSITVLVEDSHDPHHPMLSVAYMNRSETDGLRGWLGSLQRSLVERRIRVALNKKLTQLKESMLHSYKM